MKIPEGTIFCWACHKWVSPAERNENVQCFEMHEQSENYDRNAPWRDWPPYPQMPMEVMKTRDGEERIEWAYPSNDGNHKGAWVIYEPGGDYPVDVTDLPFAISSDKDPYKNKEESK